MRLNVQTPVLLLLILVATAALSGKPWNVPVAVQPSPPPPNLQIGDEVTTTIRFPAQADLERLDVSIAPVSGVQVLSQPAHFDFTNVKKGSAPQIDVTVRVTDLKIASLGVTVKTVSSGRNAAGAVTIEYR